MEIITWFRLFQCPRLKPKDLVPYTDLTCVDQDTAVLVSMGQSDVSMYVRTKPNVRTAGNATTIRPITQQNAGKSLNLHTLTAIPINNILPAHVFQ